MSMVCIVSSGDGGRWSRARRARVHDSTWVYVALVTVLGIVQKPRRKVVLCMVLVRCLHYFFLSARSPGPRICGSLHVSLPAILTTSAWYMLRVQPMLLPPHTVLLDTGAVVALHGRYSAQPDLLPI